MKNCQPIVSDLFTMSWVSSVSHPKSAEILSATFLVFPVLKLANIRNKFLGVLFVLEIFFSKFLN